MSEISDAIEQDLRSLDEILKELNKEAAKHKAERDRYHQQADVLAEKRDKLQEKAKRLSSEARGLKAQRDDYNLTASEMRQKRDEWNDKARTMRERGGLGDISGAKQMADTYHQKMVKANGRCTSYSKMLTNSGLRPKCAMSSILTAKRPLMRSTRSSSRWSRGSIM